MYVLRPRDPEIQLKNELVHTYDEAVRLDGFIAIVYSENSRRSLMIKQHFLDITDQVLSRVEAAQILGATVPNVDVWVRKGMLKGYGAGKDMVFLPADVQALKQKRGENA